MGQEVRGVPEASALTARPDAAPVDREASIGRYLAGQRRLRGVSLEDLAALTRIPLRSLERLEQGAFDSNPDGFVRGFVRTVAEALGLDPDETVMRLLTEPPGGDEERRRGGGSLQLVLLASAGLVVVSVLGLAIVWLLRGAGEAEAPVPAEILYRPDAVRALAEEEGEALRAVDSAHVAAPY
jgi:transcriptional regulator with XRE-family HTH domain